MNPLDKNLEPTPQLDESKQEKQTKTTDSSKLTTEHMKDIATERKQGVPTPPLQPPDQHQKTISSATVQKAIQTAKKPSPIVSPSREIAGQRIYHKKGDILPWMSNIFEAGERSNDFVLNEFKQLLETLKDVPQEIKENLFNQIKEEVSVSKEKLLAEKKTVFNTPELSQNLEEELLPGKKGIEPYIKITKSVEKAVHKNIAECWLKIQQLCSENQKLPQAEIDKLNAFGANISKNAQNIEGLKRFEIIHEDPFWDPKNITQRPMALTDFLNKLSIKAVSTFQAVGPAYSSQAPRNRSLNDVCAPNFFRTTLLVKPERGEESSLKQVLNATRSAITVEFDQEDPVERSKCNKKILEQVIQVHVDQALDDIKNDKVQLESASNPNTPFVVKFQTTNLLTPDVLRSTARSSPLAKTIMSKISHKITGNPADDERTLALENLQSHKELNGKVVKREIMDPDGKIKTIYVKYDLRYFNIPNNVLYAKLPAMLVDSQELTESNMESWNKLDADAKTQIKNLDNEINTIITKIVKSTKPEATREFSILSSLVSKANSLTKLREEIFEMTMRGEKGVDVDNKFIEWQRGADEMAAEIKQLENDPSLSERAKEAVEWIKFRAQYIDLLVDTSELFLTGLSKDLTKMDNNRSALAIRIILLGAMTDGLYAHFGCRSGKDRTGIVDIEIKLLLALTEFYGRMPSYREVERLPMTTNFRETISMESGNVFDFVRANLGANIGINTGGSASDPLNREEESGMQHKEFSDASEAFAKLASRAKTDFVIPPGFSNEFVRIPQIVS